ncbi:UNVERIFIED_CONTAM: Serine/threonine-protein kinase MPS1 [Sesamum radiatum]|uniref:Serine/threonine-protein kinase MPS1 n=1 Tax=Sesamum radiatum TaxID=300843 RepID=A0AAW2M456_SESRA
MQSNGIRPRRMLVPQQETSKESNMKPHSAIAAKKSKEDVLQGHRLMSSIRESKTTVSVTGDNQEDASITPPSEWGTTVNAHEENFKPCNDQRDQPGLSIRSRINDAVASSGVKPEKVLAEVRRKVHFSTEKIATSQGAHDRMATRTDDLLSHMDSLALAEMEWDVGNQVDTSAAANRDWQHHNFQRMEIDSSHHIRYPSMLVDVPPSAKAPQSDVKLENSKSEKQERGASGKATSTSRKKGYDPDLFFKVNGKLYQRLGKIGSGGSSEVHKVISSDCTIYALKKIKLRGRDYSTAYGFCQEIEYLNRLRGKNNIIQLVDYEVTDKTLLQEVMNGTMSIKDGRVKDDACIYMVLEYGEIDLAHMLAQKWKELDRSNATIDESWLRFYWQQILLAVNTIHEERIVHSDLKPANFLLVRGSLKLIDFGIAKAIMSDTTNIQRDSQVGTLSYMSPEAFMCNETDANGNTIKCGRPSDIWSLGCILYQMVYGRTPFSEYKTFWAKFKVITDPNHEIIYEPVSNPWLLDLMKKCLAWDRNERWRIPQLLQHPFLVPPVPPELPTSTDQVCTLFQLIAESSAEDQKVLNQVQKIRSVVQSESSISRDQLRKFLCEVSTVCFQLQEQLASL